MLGEQRGSGKPRKQYEMAENGQMAHVNNGYGEDSEEDDNVEDDFPGSMVFQCNSCNAILGDTMSWVDGNTDLGTFTIHSVSDQVELGTTIKASQEGMDEGSTYKDVRCTCKAKVGRYYLATTSGVDHLRKMYTLYAASTKIYKLNSGRRGTEDGQLTVGGLPLLGLHQVTLEVRKIQGLILEMYNQIQMVSQAVNVPMPSALSTAVGPENQEASPTVKMKRDSDEETEPFSKNRHDHHSDEELSNSRNTKSFEKNPSTEGRKKRERSESNETSQSSSASDRRNKKSKR